MKIFSIVVTFLLLEMNCFSQSEPTQNYEQVLENEKLKSIETMFYRSEDITNSEGKLLFKKQFDKDGKTLKKYVYTFWDVVSYDHTTTYEYDPKGNLILKTKIQKILNLGKRDEKYINALGDDPINEKSLYSYDESDRILNEVNYTFGREGFNSNDTPSNTVDYIYNEQGQLIKEVGKTPNGRIAYQNFETLYQYDKNGNKIMKTKVFTTSPTKSSRITVYTYTKKGKLVEEKTKDSETQENNSHMKYEYNKKGKMTKVLMFSNEDNRWAVMKQYSYNKNGNLMLGDDETTFNYYENGLIKRELWKSSRSDETVNFISTYEFY